MANHPMSVRFREARVLERLKAEAVHRDLSTSAFAEELIDEGLRMRRHPMVVFRNGPGGRRAALAGGGDVWEIVDGVTGGDVPTEQRVDRAAEIFGLRSEEIDAALGYYADHTDEIDDLIATNRAVAEEAEARWQRRRDLLAR